MSEIGNLPLRYQPVRRLLRLYAGLCLYGASMAAMVRANLGLDPWDVFHQGVTQHTGLSMGTVVIITGALVLLLWIPLRQWPGLGTVSNVIVIGLALDATLAVLPHPHPLALRAGFLVAGVVANGVASGLYIGARLGPGPRDGLMTGLVGRLAGRRFVSIRTVRTSIEVTVLAIGWLLGGNVGLGTVLYALAIGPLAHVFIPLFAIRSPAATTLSAATPANPGPDVAPDFDVPAAHPVTPAINRAPVLSD